MSKRSMRRGPTSRNERRKMIAAKVEPVRDLIECLFLGGHVWNGKCCVCCGVKR